MLDSLSGMAKMSRTGALPNARCGRDGHGNYWREMPLVEVLRISQL